MIDDKRYICYDCMRLVSSEDVQNNGHWWYEYGCRAFCKGQMIEINLTRNNVKLLK